MIHGGELMSITEVSRSAPTDRCSTCKVRHQGFCSWFEGDEAKGIIARATQTRFAAGTPILIQGEPASRAGIVMSGLVKIVLNDEDGSEHVIQLLHAGEMVGDPDASDCSYSWQAATDVELCWVPTSALAAAIRRCPEALHCQLDATMRQVREQRFAQVALRGRNAMQRVAHWLYLQSPTEVTLAPVRLRILLTRRDLASLLEMTVETLCRSLHQLEERGAIQLAAPDLIDLRDWARLKLLSRAQEDRQREALVQEGWEWGARSLGVRGISAPVLPLKVGQPERVAPSDLTPVNAGRRAS
jgi:CRP-like cAMP-binding protein